MHTTRRPGKIKKATSINDIPIRTKGKFIPITEPVARIDMKTIPYQVYTEFVTECNERGISFKQLFVEMWENYKK